MSHIDKTINKTGIQSKGEFIKIIFQYKLFSAQRANVQIMKHHRLYTLIENKKVIMLKKLINMVK